MLGPRYRKSGGMNCERVVHTSNTHSPGQYQIEDKQSETSERYQHQYQQRIRHVLST